MNKVNRNPTLGMPMQIHSEINCILNYDFLGPPVILEIIYRGNVHPWPRAVARTCSISRWFTASRKFQTWTDPPSWPLTWTKSANGKEEYHEDAPRRGKGERHNIICQGCWFLRSKKHPTLYRSNEHWVMQERGSQERFDLVCVDNPMAQLVPA